MLLSVMILCLLATTGLCQNISIGNDTLSTTTATNLDFGALFSDMTTTDLALVIVVCIIIAAILGYMLRQAAKSRARLREVRNAERKYAVTHFDKQYLPELPNA